MRIPMNTTETKSETDTTQARTSSFALRGPEEGHGDRLGFPIRRRIGQDGEVADELVAPAGGARDLELSGGEFAGLHAHRIGRHGERRSGQVLDGEDHRSRLVAAVGDAVSELVVDAAIGADGRIYNQFRY